MIASLSCVSTGKCNSMVELYTSTGIGRNQKIFQNLAFCLYGKEYGAASLGLASNNFPKKGSIISVVYISDDTFLHKNTCVWRSLPVVSGERGQSHVMKG